MSDQLPAKLRNATLNGGNIKNKDFAEEKIRNQALQGTKNHI